MEGDAREEEVVQKAAWGYRRSMQVVTGYDWQQAEKEAAENIAILKKVTDELLSDKAKAREFLIEHGYITPEGKLTKRYGG